MTAPGGVEADPAGLFTLSQDLGTVTEEVAAAVRTIRGVPAPGAGYGWAETAAAMERVLAAWSTELDLLRQVCAEMSSAAQRTAEDLVELDQRLSGQFNRYQMRPV